MVRCLVRFAQIREDFRLEEVRAILRAHGCAPLDERAYERDAPYWLVDLGMDAVDALLSRAVLVKEIAEVYTEGVDAEDVASVVRTGPPDLSPYREASFRVAFDDHGMKTSHEAQAAFVESLAHLPLYGKVRLDDSAELSLVLYRDIKRAVLGRRLGGCQRDLVTLYSLKRRVYLGTTSMDAELSLLMANVAGVHRGALVWDPFCGTGSLLAAAAHFGAVVVGSDIDGRTMRGGGGSLSLVGMLRQYGLAGRLAGLHVGDVRHAPFSPAFTVDAIMCDPPYGVRAGAKTIGLRPGGRPSARPEVLSDRFQRYPATRPYDMDAIVADLGNVSRRTLRPGGRLVFWYVPEPNGSKADALEIDGMARICAVAERCRHFVRHLVVFERLANTGCGVF